MCSTLSSQVSHILLKNFLLTLSPCAIIKLTGNLNVVFMYKLSQCDQEEIHSSSIIWSSTSLYCDSVLTVQAHSSILHMLQLILYETKSSKKTRRHRLVRSLPEKQSLLEQMPNPCFIFSMLLEQSHYQKKKNICKVFQKLEEKTVCS